MVRKGLIYTLIFSLLTVMFLMPAKIEAKTIKQFEDEVNKYTKELEAKKAKLAKNNKEVAEIKRKITQIENDIESAKKEVETLEKEIIEDNAKIEKKLAESKSIISYYQMSNGTNFYLEYAFGAESITDMIYRLSVVEQLTEYNNQIMKELEELIKQKQARQKELEAKQIELANLEKDLQAQKARIEADSETIIDSMPSTEAQIKAARESLNYYKKLGCGTTEDIQACEYRISQASGSSIPSVGEFSRPMEYGYVTRGISYHYSNGKKVWDHKGYDFSSSNKSIPVYPIAAGIVHKVYTDSCTSDNWCRYGCNGNAKIVVVKHNYKGKYIYSSYVHLRSISVREGQFVSSSTQVGNMGSTGCSTGPHLHLEVSNCFWERGGCNYDQYLNNIINPSSLFSIPSRWNNR